MSERTYYCAYCEKKFFNREKYLSDLLPVGQRLSKGKRRGKENLCGHTK
jgi:hypothetical protein